jgi:hypothetical protein
MRCLACNCELTDNEANRKFANHTEIKNPEAKYVGLCSNCLSDDEDFADDLINPYGEVYDV